MTKRYPTLYPEDEDGWTDWQMPVMPEHHDMTFKFACCDCSLVHEMHFKVIEQDGVQRVLFAA